MESSSLRAHTSALYSFLQNIFQEIWHERLARAPLLYSMAALGATFVVTPILLRPLAAFYRYVVRRRLNFFERFGKGWAVVTCPCSGNELSASFARELARIGYDICLVGSEAQHLGELAQKLEQDHKVATRVIKFDFQEQGAISDY